MYAHGTSGSAHIPQPPHSAGLSYKGLRAAIDPHQIPSPIEVVEADQEKWENQPFMTLPGTHPPLSTTEYVAVDQGNSAPRFLRVSTWNFPSTSRLANECEIPLAAIIQPFAEQAPGEEPIPLVETGENGPPRCAKCRGYINPWCTWVANGAKWKCNLCSHETEVNPEYYCALDSNLLRLDHSQRPELNKGTVDFTVPEEYWAPHPPPRITPLYQSYAPLSSSGHRPPRPMDYVFVLEVTMDAIRKGFVRLACDSILRAIYGETPIIPSSSRISIVTFDSTIQFYNLASHLEIPQMLVVADLDDVFLPSLDGLFVNPLQSRILIEKVLGSLSQRDEFSAVTESSLGSALCGCLSALAGRGGQVIVFASSLPTIGVGALKPREDESNMYDTDKESTLFLPRDEAWKDLGEQCAEEGIGISMFLAPSHNMDVGSVVVPASMTGGELFYHPRFDPVRDGPVMDSQLHRLLSRITVYNAVMKVRSSYGFRVSSYHGNYYENPASDLEFGTLDADKAISIGLEHSRTLDERQYAHIQAAILYTSVYGQRRVRTCNVALQVVALAGSVFRFADMDAVVSHVIREAISKLSSQRIAYIQEELTERCAAILLGYRRNCAASTSPSQLIIPEAFRAYPVYTLAMFKSKPLKARYVSSDMRNYWIHKLMGMSTRSIMHHLYPRLMALHDLNETIALPSPHTNRVDMPSLMRDSYIFMTGYGIYLIDDEETTILWIGSSVSPQLLQDLFGVEDVADINRNITQLPQIDSLLSTQVRNIIAHRRVERGGRQARFHIARQNMDGAEIEFSDMLVEDQNNAAMSYLDYLCLVHKQINTALTSGGSLPSSSSFRSSPW